MTRRCAGVLGLYAAYRFDLPAGAAIICALGAALLLCGLASVFLKKKTSYNERARGKFGFHGFRH
jgi:ABC-type Mn2+/Zn2+ transport system permease subunit